MALPSDEFELSSTGPSVSVCSRFDTINSCENAVVLRSEGKTLISDDVSGMRACIGADLPVRMLRRAGTKAQARMSIIDFAKISGA